jgi:hypothetical protein
MSVIAGTKYVLINVEGNNALDLSLADNASVIGWPVNRNNNQQVFTPYPYTTILLNPICSGFFSTTAQVGPSNQFKRAHFWLQAACLQLMGPD